MILGFWNIKIAWLEARERRFYANFDRKMYASPKAHIQPLPKIPYS